MQLRRAMLCQRLYDRFCFHPDVSNGVPPSFSWASALAPRLSSKRTASDSPCNDARCNGVHPSLSSVPSLSALFASAPGSSCLEQQGYDHGSPLGRHFVKWDPFIPISWHLSWYHGQAADAQSQLYPNMTRPSPSLDQAGCQVANRPDSLKDSLLKEGFLPGWYILALTSGVSILPQMHSTEELHDPS
jgi:hypothetical protein